MRGSLLYATVHRMQVNGEVLRTIREQSGYSLSECARQADVSKAMLSEVERGIKNPSPPLVKRLAAALGVSIADLLETEEVVA